MKQKIKPGQILIRLCLAVVTLIILIPILNILAKSVSDPHLVPYMKGWQFWPSGFDLVNYKLIFSNSLIIRSFINSVFITVVGTFLSLIVTGSAAYALTRPNLPFKKALMVFFIIMMIFEPSIIQEYFVVRNLNLLNNTWVMVIYNTVNVYYLILMMRFFEETPLALIEAAKIDGMNFWQIFFTIVLPLSKPALIAQFIFGFVGGYNNYASALMYLGNESETMWTLQLTLQQLIKYMSTSPNGDYNFQCASSLMAMIPLIIVYLFCQKFFIEGISFGGGKE